MTTAGSTVYLPRREPRHEDLALRGLRHHLTRWGERTERPIVLLHGFMDCGATWQFLADSLPSSWSLAAPDWRGFGHSDWTPDGYWFPDYLADLEALLDALVPGEKARVIGHSMGANVAQIYAGIRPKRLEWLVNLEGLGLAPSNPQQAPARFAQWLDELRQRPRERRYGSVSELASYLQARSPGLTAERADFIARAWTRPVRAAGRQGSEAGPPAGEVELLFDPRHRRVNPMLYRREEARACWAAVQAPVLLVTGDASDHASRIRTHGEEMRRDIRHLRSVTIGGVGHMMHHENPAAVARHIVEFESDVATRRQPPDPE